MSGMMPRIETSPCVGFSPTMLQYRGGRADRSAGVGAKGAVAEFGGHRRSRTAGRTAGIALERPRIPHRTVIARRRRPAERELVQVQLPDDHRTGGEQAAHDLCVLGGQAIVEDGAGRGCARAHGVDVVLERDRNTVERSAQLAGTLLLVEHLGARERLLAHHGDERVQLRLVDGDPREAGGHQFHGRDAARTNPC